MCPCLDSCRGQHAPWGGEGRGVLGEGRGEERAQEVIDGHGLQSGGRVVQHI
jgi:hypothetical protein